MIKTMKTQLKTEEENVRFSLKFSFLPEFRNSMTLIRILNLRFLLDKLIQSENRRLIRRTKRSYWHVEDRHSPKD